MSSNTVTHKDLAALLGVSETTIKSYRKKFSEFIPVHSRGKPIRFPQEAVDVCRTIRQGFLDDLSVDELRARLSETFPLVAVRSVKKNGRADVVQNVVPRDVDAHAGVELVGAVERLAVELEKLSQAQQETNQRLDALQAQISEGHERDAQRAQVQAEGLDGLRKHWTEQLSVVIRSLAASLGNTVASAVSSASEDGRSEVLGALENLVQASVMAQAPGRKRVSVKNSYGDTSEYYFETHVETHVEAQPVTRAKAPGKPVGGAPAPTPPPALLRQPLVVESEQGEYLGVAGRAEKALCLVDVNELLEKSYTPPHHFSVSWEQTARGWNLMARQSQAARPQTYNVFIQDDTTPKGNRVALLYRLEVNGRSVPCTHFYTFIKRMKEMITPTP